MRYKFTMREQILKSISTVWTHQVALKKFYSSISPVQLS